MLILPTSVEELNEMHRKGELTATSQSSYINDLTSLENSGDSEDASELDAESVNCLNETIDGLRNNEIFEDSLNQFMYLVHSENFPIDFRHTETKMTALMIFVGCSAVDSVEILLNLGANPRLKMPFSGNEIDCLDIAYSSFGSESDIFKLLQQHLNSGGARQLNLDEIYDKALVNIYYDTQLTNKSNNRFVVEESVDSNLIVQIIEKSTMSRLSILAFFAFFPALMISFRLTGS